MELEQRTFEDIKNRMHSEFSTEKDRLIKEIHQKDQEFELQREKLLKDKKEMVEHLNREFSEKIRLIEKRNQVTLLCKGFFFLITILMNLVLFFLKTLFFCSVKLSQLASNLNRILQYGSVNKRQHLNYVKSKNQIQFDNNVELKEINKLIQLLPKLMKKHLFKSKTTNQKSGKLFVIYSIN